MGDLSRHFSSSEFRSKDEATLTHAIDQALVDVLERIRHAAGDRPLTIVSGYRTPAHNRAVGGARNSQHLYGRAADIPRGFVSAEVAHRCGARGVGVCDGWAVHVDTRPGPPVTFKDC